MRREDNPCYKCVPPKRKVGCHSTCKEYKEYLVRYREEKKALESERQKSVEFNKYNHHKARRLKGWSEE